jgi:hypothetical protein
MKLILHIGTEKTGSTSIQKFLIENREALIRDKIFMPLSPLNHAEKPANGNHRYFPYFAHNENHKDELWWRMKGDAASKRRIISDKKERFIRECKDAFERCDVVVVSSEHVSSRLNRPEEIKRLHAFCSGIFEQIEIVLYIRDPLSLSISAFSESLKAGWTGHELPKAKDFNFKYSDYKFADYASLLSQWRSNFPSASFRVRRFDKKNLTDGDVVRDFASHFLPHLTKENYVFSRNGSNVGLSLTGMALLSRLNSEFPPIVDGKQNILRGDLKHFVAKHTRDGSKFIPSKDQWKDYRDFFLEVNSSIHMDFFPDDEFLFGDNFGEYAVRNIDLREVEINPIIYEHIIFSLWRQMHQSKRK